MKMYTNLDFLSYFLYFIYPFVKYSFIRLHFPYLSVFGCEKLPPPSRKKDKKRRKKN